MTQPDLFHVPPPEPVGHRLARKAAEKNERASPGWMALACALVDTYSQEHAGTSWLLEDARAFAEARGLPSPSDKRSWGHVVGVLRRQGRIVTAGFAGAKSSHGSPKVLWRRK